jgi:hypothetical protein
MISAAPEDPAAGAGNAAAHAAALHELRRHFVEGQGAHTLLLYGSRARGDASQESDWDVVAVRDEGESLREARPFCGAWLDAFVHPAAHFDALDEGSLRFRGGTLLHDARGFGQALLARLDDLERAGPKPLPADEEQVIRVWYPKMLARAARDDVEGRYRRAWLLFDALEAYFKLRNQFYRGPKESLRWLARHAPESHRAFARALAPDASHDDVAALVACVLG